MPEDPEPELELAAAGHHLLDGVDAEPGTDGLLLGVAAPDRGRAPLAAMEARRLELEGALAVGVEDEGALEGLHGQVVVRLVLLHGEVEPEPDLLVSGGFREEERDGLKMNYIFGVIASEL